MTRNRMIAGLIAGLVGGAIFYVAIGAFLGLVAHLVISGLLGVVFGLAFGPRLKTGGASLVWGEAYGIMWWLLGYLTLLPLVRGNGIFWSVDQIRPFFAFLIGQVLPFGAVLGLVYYGMMKLLGGEEAIHEEEAAQKRPTSQAIIPPRLQSVIIGGLGGLAGAWVFLRGIEGAAFFPLVASLIGSDSAAIGQLLHYTIGLIIGVTFGLLFYRDIKSTGASIVWGMTYGITWWMMGPMTLRPILAGEAINWTLEGAQAAFTPLIAHMLYGAIVGLFYALATKVWNVLFVDSDPLSRTRESSGARGVRGLLMGQAAGIVGGLIFTIVMVSINALPRVASLVGGDSVFLGFLVHLAIAFLIGSSYGLLFHSTAYGYGSGLGWGLLYGLLWWLLGPGTLFFILLRQPVDWSLAGAIGRYPALVGHLLYGMGMGLFFQYLVRRYDTHTRTQSNKPHVHQTAGTPAAALWAVTLLIGVLLPLILATGDASQNCVYC